MARPKRKVDTWKTKKWFKILAPSIFGEKEIGITPASEVNQIIGRTIGMDLYSITGKRDLQHVKVVFRVNDLEGETGKPIPIGQKMQRAYIGRLARRMHTIVKAITTIMTKDGYKVQITAMAMSRGKARQSQKREIRRMMVEKIGESADKPFEKLFQDIIYGKLAGEMFKASKKVFPISRIEIEKTELLEMPGE